MFSLLFVKSSMTERLQILDYIEHVTSDLCLPHALSLSPVGTKSPISCSFYAYYSHLVILSYLLVPDWAQTSFLLLIF